MAVPALVRDIMDRDPLTVTGETDVRTVVRLLRQHDLTGVPVVDDDRRLRGIITESDLVIADEEGDLHLPHYIELFGGYVFLEPLQRFEDRLHKAFASSAADMMTREPTTVTPDATIHEAGRIIAERGHNRLPVTEGDRLVGVVTRADVLGALAREG
jgi:CBS domain-containing protein